MRTRRLLVALALPLALTGLAACGDDGDSATEPSGASAGESAGDPASSDSPESESSDDGADDASESPSTEPSETADPAADWPECGATWADEQKLPRGYRGCREGDQAVKAEARPCSFGRPLVTYDDRFWAVPSGVIHEASGSLEKDPAYRSDLKSCTA